MIPFPVNQPAVAQRNWGRKLKLLLLSLAVYSVAAYFIVSGFNLLAAHNALGFVFLVAIGMAIAAIYTHYLRIWRHPTP
jgi:hypothetical protein